MDQDNIVVQIHWNDLHKKETKKKKGMKILYQHLIVISYFIESKN